MSQSDLGNILDELHEKEFSEFRNAPSHHFSMKHRRAMKQIFTDGNDSKYKPVRLTKRTALVIVILIFLALITASLMVYRTAGFRGNVHNDNIHMFASDITGSPDVIEREYSLGYVPDSYELVKHIGNTGDNFLMREFSISGSDSYIIFYQYTKAHFNSHFDNKNRQIESITINGCDGFWWTSQNDDSSLNKIVWADDDYIFSVSGNLDKEKVKELANSTKLIEI